MLHHWLAVGTVCGSSSGFRLRNRRFHFFRCWSFLDHRCGRWNENSLQSVKCWNMLEPPKPNWQAIWATLGVGAAYVPIDPEYPVERIKHILDNAQPKLMLCREEKRQLIETAEKDCEIFAVEDWPEPKGKSSVEHIEQAPPLHLAYIIYTSGSTGKPKARELKMSVLLCVSHFKRNPSHGTEGCEVNPRVWQLITVLLQTWSENSWRSWTFRRKIMFSNSSSRHLMVQCRSIWAHFVEAQNCLTFQLVLNALPPTPHWKKIIWWFEIFDYILEFQQS